MYVLLHPRVSKETPNRTKLRKLRKLKAKSLTVAVLLVAAVRTVEEAVAYLIELQAFVGSVANELLVGRAI